MRRWKTYECVCVCVCGQRVGLGGSGDQDKEIPYSHLSLAVPLAATCP